MCSNLEVSVMASDNRIIIEWNPTRSRTIMATYISQCFIQRYTLPPEHDSNQINSSISSDGILTISATKQAVSDAEGHKSIPIVSTGQPLKRIGADVPITRRRQEEG
ncbi:heat shock protein 23-like [Aedes albopictus]|uniref:SHSP domain-containing protein n=1 Tax=Aedes albopictus TaxID=7160 RepID=A0ABM1XL37_AEDAL